MQKWVLDEAARSTFVLLVEYGDPLTRERYLNINNVDEDDLDAERETTCLICFRSR
jgi:hypothetical protein